MFADLFLLKKQKLYTKKDTRNVINSKHKQHICWYLPPFCFWCFKPPVYLSFAVANPLEWIFLGSKMITPSLARVYKTDNKHKPPMMWYNKCTTSWGYLYASFTCSNWSSMECSLFPPTPNGAFCTILKSSSLLSLSASITPMSWTMPKRKMSVFRETLRKLLFSESAKESLSRLMVRSTVTQCL